MAAVRPFHRYRGESSFTMPQFLAILRELIPQVVPTQSRYRVTELPTERTLRYYVARKLVDRPTAPEGARARYGYRHLLQVLAVKYLQSQYLALVKIGSLVENVSNRDLELLIPAVAPATAAHHGIAREDRHLVEYAFFPRVENMTIPERSPQSHPVESPGAFDTDDTWHRIEVGPGIELQVHTAALTAEDRDRLRGALLRELGVLRGWFGEGKKESPPGR